MPVPWDEVVRRGRLTWIQSSAAGLDHCLVPSVVGSSIIVTSASGVLADQVAEHTLALITACTRRIPLFLEQQARREFVRRPTRDLTGATVVIVGLGGNGRRLVEVLAPFRVRILATDWFPVHRPPEVEFLGGPDTLADLLPQADILLLAAPLTEHTRGMIDAAAIARMKPGSIIVNVARGPLIDEQAARRGTGQWTPRFRRARRHAGGAAGPRKSALDGPAARDHTARRGAVRPPNRCDDRFFLR